MTGLKRKQVVTDFGYFHTWSADPAQHFWVLIPLLRICRESRWASQLTCHATLDLTPKIPFFDMKPTVHCSILSINEVLSNHWHQPVVAETTKLRYTSIMMTRNLFVLFLATITTTSAFAPSSSPHSSRSSELHQTLLHDVEAGKATSWAGARWVHSICYLLVCGFVRKRRCTSLTPLFSNMTCSSSLTFRHTFMHIPPPTYERYGDNFLSTDHYSPSETHGTRSTNAMDDTPSSSSNPRSHHYTRSSTHARSDKVIHTSTWVSSAMLRRGMMCLNGVGHGGVTMG
jgi:hypothetical protein